MSKMIKMNALLTTCFNETTSLFLSLPNQKFSEIESGKSRMDKTFRKTRLKNKEYDWITYQVNHNSYFKNAIPVIGYCFDFSDVLKTFLVLQY
ncbi:hypothetical protein [Capnocytophaga cynodegmi]|uniref:hypothetical protein n=1 Tax=Capnocytophaga cynodegmi TaxID=28189 RepID=UPI001EE16BB3|nr:hypothetical protein [Capnocytophaga cynodegmi]